MAEVDSVKTLKKFSGKGGWTYAEIPEIPPDREAHFGWVQVNGTIDGYKLKKQKLMPLGNGTLFLPVKAAVRKTIGKEKGDTVHVRLEIDRTPAALTDELIDCFKNESPIVLENYHSLAPEEQKAYLDWIYAAKTDESKVERIVKMMDELLMKKRLNRP